MQTFSLYNTKMHFRVTNAFTFIFVFLSILSMANPLSSSPRDNVALKRLDERQAASDIIGVIVDVVNDVIEAIITDIVNFENDAHAAESNFTQQTVISLGNQYPDKNRLIFHDQDSTYNLSPDAVHVHHELDIGLGFTYGYEIWVFDSGTFERAGDGGYINWAFAGCFTQQDADVTFTKC